MLTVEECRKWINEMPEGASRQLANETGLSYTWVRSFANGYIKDPRSSTHHVVSSYITRKREEK